LFLSAVAFWRLILTLIGARRWHAVPVLLLTGKLSCLLAALLVFSPRVLYGPAFGLDDQHLAGLLMISACPLSYLVAGVVLSVQLVGGTAPARERS
jgi:putative membrane protein